MQRSDILVGFLSPEERLSMAASRSQRKLRKLLLWQHPSHSLLVLLIATAVHQHCSGPGGKPFLALLADLLLALTCACRITGFLFRHVKLWSPSLRISDAVILELVAAALLIFSAASHFVRSIAAGAQPSVFLLSMLVLYLCSVLGKLLSTATFLYLGLWALFTIPWMSAKWRSHRAHQDDHKDTEGTQGPEEQELAKEQDSESEEEQEVDPGPEEETEEHEQEQESPRALQ